MKISYNWLKRFLKTDLPSEQISVILTDIGLEVESVEKFESIKGGLKGFVVGEVLEVDKHPNADKLKLTQIKISDTETLKVVCGAPNVQKDQKVVLATVGTEIHSGDSSFTIKKSKIRGEESYGMLCSEVELSLGEDNSGIMILDDSLQVGTPLSEVYDVQEDYIFEIGLTPNRSDAMSHLGVARDLFAALKFKKNPAEFIEPETQKLESNSKEEIFKVEIEEKDLCKRYSVIYLENIQVKESPNWIKNHLKSIDVEPINNVVDITNFVLHHFGQPLHAFDAKKIQGNTVRVGKVSKGTKFTTLDNVERELNGNELLIKDGNNNPMCLAGIFGGKESGVSNTTTSILLESAYFNPVSIRKTSKQHQLNTDSSFRFERGCDPNITVKALEYAVELLKEYANAEVKQELIDIYPKPIENHNVIFRYYRIDKLLGHKIHREEIKKILNLLDIEIISDYNENLELSIPPYRADVTREVDVIEEILRIYGYNTVELPEKISFSHIVTSKNERLIYENKIATLLTSNGYYECLNNSLVPIDEKVENKVTLLNPLSNDLAMMRNHLIGGLLENISYNLNRKQTSIRLFEYGKSYEKINKEYTETDLLTIAVCGNTSETNWITPANQFSFYELRGLVEQILSLTGIDNFDEKYSENGLFSEAIEFKIKDDTILELGVLDKKITKQKDISIPVYVANINFQNVLKHKNTNRKFREIAKFPTSKRDLSLILDETISYKELQQEALKAEKNLLKKVQLFDVYQGDKIPENKKSYALSFYLQDESKTLTDKVIDKAMEKILESLKKNYNVELRN
ncbi:MAG: phenylalanine--tRNA ligase subunit beta [Flavobacteriales bacterium]|nr:phenylalanine--tRNA ligase subunit beta [Flavobacteriales bacterium]